MLGFLRTPVRRNPGRSRLEGQDRGRLGLAPRRQRLRLGLERLQRLERTPELGPRRAAIAKQRRKGAGTVALPDQGKTEVAITPALLLEHLRLHAVGTLEAPGGCGDAPGKQRLQGAFGRELGQESLLVRLVPGSILMTETTSFCARRPCFRAFCDERALPSGVFGPRDFAPLRRLASARALRLGRAVPGAPAAWLDMA
jgi:hypothetical protein